MPIPGQPNISIGDPVAAGRALLRSSDFTYLGYYDVQLNGNNSPYGQDLTHRYVNDQLRFLTLDFVGGTTGYVLDEFSIAGKAFGAQIKTRTNRWNNVGFAMPNGQWYSLWYDQATDRLWMSSAVDYTATVVPTKITTRTLNADGTIANYHGPVSLEGMAAKRAYGGAQRVPAWFQQQYHVGPYAVGWGGYTSLVNSGGGASMGPTMYTIPDVANYPSGGIIPAGSFRTIMDYAGNHRGRRVTIPINYYDGGDPRQNPSTPPTVPPAPGAGWQSPGPDGRGYFVWGDTYWNNAQWIDTARKTGFIAVASLGGGKCWYGTSTLHSDIRQFELHVFDPAELGAGALPYTVWPKTMTELLLPGLGGGDQGNTPTKDIDGVTFDATTKTLYMMGFGISTFWNRLYAFAVDC